MIEYPYFPKQLQALKALANDSNVTDVLFGGGKGGAKSALGCRWQIERRLKYKGTKSIIGRSSLKELKKSTLVTMFEWLSRYGLVEDIDWTYNAQEMFLRFYNGSEIHFFDLFDYPSDPEFQRFGGIEIMDFFVDEAGEISSKCYRILKTLCRKHLRDFCRFCGHNEPRSDYLTQWTCSKCGQVTSGLPIKGLMSCNPAKNWLYHEFFNPHRNNKLPPDRSFIPALATDNPTLPRAYIEELEKLPEHDRKRLLEGDWDYDESKDRIFDYQDLVRMFEVPMQNGNMYTTADVAAMGDDDTIVGVWQGLSLVHIYKFFHKLPHEIANEIRNINTRHSVPLRNTAVDSDGLGIGVAGALNCTNFHNGASAVKKEDYENLRSECYYTLADKVRLNQIGIHVNVYKETIIQELDAVRRKNMHSEKKLGIIPREEIIKTLGRSPDFASMIMMRMYYELHPNRGKYVIV